MRELSAAMRISGRQPPRIAENCLVEYKAADRRWFDAAFTEDPGCCGNPVAGRREPDGAVPKGGNCKRQRGKTPVEKPASMITQDYKGFSEELPGQGPRRVSSMIYLGLLSEVREHAELLQVSPSREGRRKRSTCSTGRSGLADSLRDMLKVCCRRITR